MTTISINVARRLTGTYLKDKTDEEVQDFINQLYGLAEIVVEKSISDGSNSKREVVDIEEEKDQNIGTKPINL